ncbi:MAG: anti-sigma factor antagonist [Phycisphaerales bacterium]|nr:MAG: anti-sigma factor antagonist [Phycisphaerales bacterium]
MEVQSERTGETAVIRPLGDVDMSGSPELRASIRAAQNEGPRRVVVDLAEVAYMDSSGLATLVEAMKNAKASGSELILASMGEKVRAIFEIARLDAYFRIVGSVDEVAG